MTTFVLRNLLGINLVRSAGVEPATLGSGGLRSIHLSYERSHLMIRASKKNVEQKKTASPEGDAALKCAR